MGEGDTMKTVTHNHDIDCLACLGGDKLVRLPGTRDEAADILLRYWDKHGDKGKMEESGRWCWMMQRPSTLEVYACSGSLKRQADTIVNSRGEAVKD